MADTKKQTLDINAEVKKLFELGAHLGHKKNRLYPKSRRYIYKIINGVSIIDLSQTVGQLDEAKKAIAQFAQEGKNVLVVATKKVAGQFVQDYCRENNIAYITNKWLPGLLTNFDTIIKNVKKLRDLKTQKEAGEWNKFIKYEQVQLEKELFKLEKFYGGLIALEKKPDVLFVVDIKKEKNAVKEATAYHLPVVALVDTNSNPELVKYAIVANDDTAEVIKHIVTEVLSTYVKAKKTEVKKVD